MTTNAFIAMVRRSRLVDESQLTTFLEVDTASSGRGDSDDAGPLAVALVKSGILTEWQSESLLAGRYKGFMLGEYKLLRHLSPAQHYLAEHIHTRGVVTIAVSPGGTVREM